MIKRIVELYFSPTGGTKSSTDLVADYIGKQTGLEKVRIDITQFESRQKVYQFEPEDLLIIGMPVYAGRIPNKLAPDLEKILKGNQTPFLSVISFGNRSSGDAIRELQKILEKNGFQPVGAAAIATRHAFTDQIATERPDSADREEIKQWCDRIVAKLKESSIQSLPSVLEKEIAPYYVPLMENGKPAKFLKAKPRTKEELCDQCGICAKNCPMGSIDRENCIDVKGICIKCQACIRKCPKGAKYFDDAAFLSHVRMLEQNYIRKAENVFVLS